MGTPLLRDCSACDKEISRHSAFCRHCGHPQTLPLAIWLCILLLLMLIAIYMAFCLYGYFHVQELRVKNEPGEKLGLVMPTALELAAPTKPALEPVAFRASWRT